MIVAGVCVLRKGSGVAQIGISEFTFGFAFLREQVNLQDIVGYPALPSLSAENSLGWDAAITPTEGTVIFYQFKMSEYLSHGNSKHVEDGMYSSYYRFFLHPDGGNRQHRLLKDLGDTLAPTYYVAPEVPTEALFSAAYQTETVITSSRLIPLIECPAVSATDVEKHYITYAPGTTEFTFHSEPKRRVGSVFGRELPQLYKELLDRRQKLDEAFVHSFLRKARSIASIPQEVAKTETANVEESSLGQLARFMAANFGVITAVIAENSSS